MEHKGYNIFFINTSCQIGESFNFIGESIIVKFKQ